MIRSMWTAATGMSAQELMIDVVANNIANTSTTSFKKSRAEFEDLFYENIRSSSSPDAAGGARPTGVQVGMGTRPVSVQKMFFQGDYLETKNELDMAIEGKGFFLVNSDGTDYYTRDGAFKINADGVIVNSQGDILQPEFAVPSDTVKIEISGEGHLVCFSGTNPEVVLAETDIPTYLFTNDAGLKAVGSNYYVETASSGAPIQGTPGTDNYGTIAQGFLEQSNVNAVEEMINMIASQRAYEMNSRTIRTADTMLQTVSQLVR